MLQQRFITSARFKWKQLDWRGRLRSWRKISWNRMTKVIIKWMFTFLSVSKFTCKAISVFSLLGSRVREFKSPPPVLIRPLNKKKERKELEGKSPGDWNLTDTDIFDEDTNHCLSLFCIFEKCIDNSWHVYCMHVFSEHTTALILCYFAFVVVPTIYLKVTVRSYKCVWSNCLYKWYRRFFFNDY